MLAYWTAFACVSACIACALCIKRRRQQIENNKFISHLPRVFSTITPPHVGGKQEVKWNTLSHKLAASGMCVINQWKENTLQYCAYATAYAVAKTPFRYLPQLGLILEMLHKTLAGRVMIHNGHIAALIRMQHGNVHLDDSLVLPQRCWRARVQVHFKGHCLKVNK